jgi:hypothetical protein
VGLGTSLARARRPLSRPLGPNASSALSFPEPLRPSTTASTLTVFAATAARSAALDVAGAALGVGASASASASAAGAAAGGWHHISPTHADAAGVEGEARARLRAAAAAMAERAIVRARAAGSAVIRGGVEAGEAALGEAILSAFAVAPPPLGAGTSEGEGKEGEGGAWEAREAEAAEGEEWIDASALLAALRAVAVDSA